MHMNELHVTTSRVCLLQKIMLNTTRTHNLSAQKEKKRKAFYRAQSPLSLPPTLEVTSSSHLALDDVSHLGHLPGGPT